MVSRRHAAFEFFRALVQLFGALLDFSLVVFAVWNLYMLATSEHGSADERNAIRGAVSLILTFSIATFARVGKAERKR